MDGNDVGLSGFRVKLLDWAHEPDQIKQTDLLLELDSWENRDLHRRMLVVDLLRSTEMWDKKGSPLSPERTDSDCPTGTG